MRTIILASSSPYRRALLERLQIPFSVAVPDTDERALDHESVDAQVERLAIAKSHAVAQLHPDALIIGSDQLASVDGTVLGKPGDRDRAIAQLQRCRNRDVRFSTGVALFDSRSAQVSSRVVHFDVRMRALDDDTLARYVDRDQPFDCAGSFRAEGLGISLFSAMTGDDPTSLIGLPLIAVVDLLAERGVKLPL